ncbi:MAG: FAD-binding protein [Corynebacteriales bacterium]|nr:FAD-binding protein [Mycobacteriales bacterium]
MFADVPELDGTLVFTEDALTANSRDTGNIFHERPHAVLRPGSVKDIRKMIRFCGAHDIKVAPRGLQGKSDLDSPQLGGSFMGGGLVQGGLAIEMRWLNKIHSIGPDGAVVDAGLQWDDLIRAAYDKGLTPPAITGYTQLTVGGTIAYGGYPTWSTNRGGSQADRVQWIEVVTGTGEFKRCSPSENSDLFHAVLGGQGQFGVMTRAKLDLVPAKQMARTYLLTYPQTTTFDTKAFFKDFRILLDRNEFSFVTQLNPPATVTPFTIAANIFYDQGSEPDTAHLLRDLSISPEAVPFSDKPYLDLIFSVDQGYDTFKAMLDWDNKIHPWSTLFIPDDKVEQFFDAVLPTLTTRDLGGTGFLITWPSLRADYKRPLVRVPDNGKWVWLFGLTTDSDAPAPDTAYVTEMLARNRRLWEKAVELGGMVEPECPPDLTSAEWQKHYAPVWSKFSAWKRKFDPDHILTPGPGIF